MITTIGVHKVKQGLIEGGIADLMGSDKADLIYTDPPWGEGTMKWWQKLNEKDTGKAPVDITYDSYMNDMFKILAEYGAGNICIEYGVKWADDLIKRAESYGLVYGTTIELVYRSGSKMAPCHLHLFGNGKAPVYPSALLQDAHHQYGYKLLQQVFRHLAVPGGIVLDPTCGLGYTAKAAVEFGMKFRGNEMNAKRLEKTKARLK